jgi:hypothetical protein
MDCVGVSAVLLFIVIEKIGANIRSDHEQQKILLDSLIVLFIEISHIGINVIM